MQSKNELIASGKYRLFLEIKKDTYLKGLNQDNYKYYQKDFDEDEYKIMKLIYNANKQRKYNSQNEISKWLFEMNSKNNKNYKLVFITLTFDNQKLEKTSELTRRRYVGRFLNDNTLHYQANVDYGKENNREHYHAIAIIEKNIDQKLWTKGYSYIETIKVNKKNIVRVKSYLNKLNNHSYKETTRLKRIIRDRRPSNALMDFMIDNVYKKEFIAFKSKLFEK